MHHIGNIYLVRLALVTSVRTVVCPLFIQGRENSFLKCRFYVRLAHDVSAGLSPRVLLSRADWPEHSP